MRDKPRLIEVAFPLRQASLDSVHEKNVRHGHISTLHIWPARRPLAACRAALIATLLPDPGNAEERKELLDKLAGRVKEVVERKREGGRIVERAKEVTEGGILHWGRESGPDLDWFRRKIREAYGGRAPKVLDPFAGGGAIPLEAMRLGCEATAMDLNPVAWFILKCTVEYPQKLAGQTRPLPPFVLQDRKFMEAFFKAQGFKGAELKAQLAKMGLGQDQMPRLTGMDQGEASLTADLAWQVRAWGWWVLTQARAELSRFYPTVNGKPTVAYLWARTVKCKNCRATVPLLKTRWLCKKDNKRVRLTMEPNADKTGVVFGIEKDVPQGEGGPAARREHDRKLGASTMSRAGAKCPCCEAIMTMEDIRLEGRAGRLGAVMTAVVVNNPNGQKKGRTPGATAVFGLEEESAKGKDYRLPNAEEGRLAAEAERELARVFGEIPFGLPQEPTPKAGLGASRAFSVDGYGFDQWHKLFTPRQLVALGTFVMHTRAARQAMAAEGYPEDWIEAVGSYLAISLDRLASFSSNLCRWEPGGEFIVQTFARFALPILWDYAETGVLSNTSGNYYGGIDWVSRYLENCLPVLNTKIKPSISTQSAPNIIIKNADLIITDPPYYDAIPYSDCMDFFYVWLRRTLNGLSPEIDAAFLEPLAPKWDHEKNNGELIDDASRFGGDREKSKAAYEEGMYRAFLACHRALVPEGRLVVVFANKQPDAWEALVSAIIKAGFIVDGSWPIQTEREARSRAHASAALSSSVWMVCKKRPEAARPGWDNRVLTEMEEKITTQLREFWDAGIRGPDFVWAATGPALEAYSRHPAVKKANEAGQLLAVSEFLSHVRRIVVDFVVGRVLSGNGGAEAVSGLDDITTYYLLHRHTFGMNETPIGPCILYAISCGLSDGALVDQHDLLSRTGGQEAEEEDSEEDEEDLAGGDARPTEAHPTETDGGSGSKVKLKPWNKRLRPGLGYPSATEASFGRKQAARQMALPEVDRQELKVRQIPLIDQVHRLLHLWKAGDVATVNDYLDERGLLRHALFHQLLQALIELAPRNSEERSLLESLSNHVSARGMPQKQQLVLETVPETGGDTGGGG